MAHNIAKNAVERTSDELLGKVFPSLGKVSGWLARYGFASPVRDHLWKEGVAPVGRDAVVARRRAAPLRLALLKGRRGLDAETALFDDIVGAVGGDGIPVHDRGFDSRGASDTRSGRDTGPSCASRT